MLVETLLEAGASVDVVAGVPHYPQWKLQDSRYRRGLRWREFDGDARLTRVRHAVPSRPSLMGRARLESTFASLATPFVRASAAEIIIAVTPLVGAMVAGQAGRRGRPIGIIVHDLTANAAHQSGTTGGRASQMIGSAEYALLKRATAIGVITPGFAPSLLRHGVAPDRITQLPIFTHVAGSNLSAADARRRLGWPEAAMTVVHTGNMGMKQGLDHAVAAARQAQKLGRAYRFVFVGDGNQRAELELQSTDLDNISFVDPVPEVDYPTVLAAADVLLLHERPGVDESSLPSKLTSYSAAGRPIVAAVEVEGITSSLLNSYGAAVAVRSGDASALIDALDRVLADPDIRQAAVDGAARMAAAEFSDGQGRRAFRTFASGLASGRTTTT